MSQMSAASPQPQAPQSPAGIPCYDANGLNITFQIQRNAEGMIQAIAKFRNSGSGTLSNVGLQAAVPKTQKLQLLSISSTDIGPGAEATQMMRVSGCKGVSIPLSLLILNKRLLMMYPLASATTAEGCVHSPNFGTSDGPGQLDGAVLKDLTEQEEDISVVDPEVLYVMREIHGWKRMRMPKHGEDRINLKRRSTVSFACT
jgi:hypothetical protein